MGPPEQEGKRFPPEHEVKRLYIAECESWNSFRNFPIDIKDLRYGQGKQTYTI